MLGRAVFFVSLTLVGACTLLVRTNDLAGTRMDDAAPPGNEGSTDGARDAPFDLDAADGGGSSPDGEPERVSPCASPHAFCDDFDDGGTDLASRWNSIQTNGGTLSLKSERVISAPRSLRTFLPTPSGNGDTKIVKTVPIPSGKATIDFDVIVDHTDGDFGEVDPIEVVLRPAPPGFNHIALYIVLRPSQIAFQYLLEKSDGGFTDKLAAIPFTFGVWHHVRLTYTSNPPRTTIDIDGTTAALDGVTGPAVTTLDVGVGAPFVRDLKNNWTLDTDNVVVDTP